MTLKKAIAKAWLAFAISLTTLALFCINASAAAKTTVVLVDETYLLSDLGNNCESVFDEDACSSFEGIVTIVYYPSEYEYSVRKFIERMQAQMPKATFEIC